MQLMLAVNDEHGNPAGQVVGLAVGDELLELEGPGYFGDAPGDTFEYQRLIEPKVIYINQCAWPVAGYASHVGNVMWDMVEIAPAILADLLNYLRGLGHWNCTAGESGLFDKWHAGQAFAADDLSAFA